uniref:Uncharacterized protein n=1 Tax=Trichogramma kaykai TaxID=54128 RepID=A0ABD2X011_9HYME
MKRANWETFAEELETNKSFFDSLEYLNSPVIVKYDLFMGIIDSCIKKSLPAFSQRPKNKYPSEAKNIINNVKNRCIWWNEECDRAIRLRKSKLASLKYRCDLQKIIEYNKVCAITRRTLKSVKKNSFMNFCSSINRNTKISSVWSRIKMFNNGITRPQSTNSNTNLQIRAKETLDSLCAPKDTSLFPPSTSDIFLDQSIHTDNHFLSEPFFYEEITRSIYSPNPKTSPRVDRISYEILSYLPEFYIRVLLTRGLLTL